MPHIHEKIDFVTEAFIVHGNKVLLRMHDKYHIWLAPGGHIELDEDPVKAAIREAKEEVGLDISIVGSTKQIEGLDPDTHLLTPPRFMQRHRINDAHEHICLYYFATCDSDEVIVSGSDRSDEWKWFTAEELADPKYGIRADVKYYASEALRELGSVA